MQTSNEFENQQKNDFCQSQSASRETGIPFIGGIYKVLELPEWSRSSSFLFQKTFPCGSDASTWKAAHEILLRVYGRGIECHEILHFHELRGILRPKLRKRENDREYIVKTCLYISSLTLFQNIYSVYI